MHQPSPQQPAGNSLNVPSEVTNNASRGYLAKHTLLYKPSQQVRVPLERFDALRVGQNGRHSLELKPKEHVLGVVGIPKERQLDQGVP